MLLQGANLIPQLQKVNMDIRDPILSNGILPHNLHLKEPDAQHDFTTTHVYSNSEHRCLTTVV